MSGEVRIQICEAIISCESVAGSPPSDILDPTE